MTPATHFLPCAYTRWPEGLTPEGSASLCDEAMASPLSEQRQALIKSVYEDPETGFGSVRDTFLQARAKDPGVRYIDVKTFLDKLAHRQTQFRYRGHNSWVSPHRLFEIEVDLIDLTATAEENGGFRYALVAMDNFSKFAHAVPVKGKTPDVLVAAMQEILVKIGVPKQVYSDYEGSFDSPAWNQLMNQNGIKMIQTVGSANMVERLNRTLKGMLQTRLDAQGLRRFLWVQELGPILRKYNNTTHSTIEMSPNEALLPANELLVAFNLSKHAVKKRRYPDLSVGDRVRVLLKKDSKRKGYMPRWSPETFRVMFEQDGDYRVNDDKRRVYHRHELLKVD